MALSKNEDQGWPAIPTVTQSMASQDKDCSLSRFGVMGRLGTGSLDGGIDLTTPKSDTNDESTTSTIEIPESFKLQSPEFDTAAFASLSICESSLSLAGDSDTKPDNVQLAAGGIEGRRGSQFSLFAYPMVRNGSWHTFPQPGMVSPRGDRSLYNPMGPGPFALFAPNAAEARGGGYQGYGMGAVGSKVCKNGHVRSFSQGTPRQWASASSVGILEACGSGPLNWAPGQGNLDPGRNMPSLLTVGSAHDGVRRHSVNGPYGDVSPVVGSTRLAQHRDGDPPTQPAGPLDRADCSSWQSDESIAHGLGSDIGDALGAVDGDSVREGLEHPITPLRKMGGSEWAENDDGEECERPVVKERKRGKRGGKRFRCDRGLRCHSAQCRRTHPTGWRPCPNMVTGGCMDAACLASCHREMCENFFSCTRKLCCYGHSWGRAALDGRGAVDAQRPVAHTDLDIPPHRHLLVVGGSAPGSSFSSPSISRSLVADQRVPQMAVPQKGQLHRGPKYLQANGAPMAGQFGFPVLG